MSEENENKANGEEKKLKIPDVLPVLALRDIVMFPYMVLPIFAGRSKSKQAVDRALSSDRLLLLLTQKEPGEEDPQPQDLHTTGTVAMIVRMLKLPDGRMRVLLQGITRGKVEGFETGDESIISARISPVEDREPARDTLRNRALLKNCREKFEQTLRLGKAMPSESLVLVQNVAEYGKVSDLIAAHLDLSLDDAQTLLAEPVSIRRMQKVHELLSQELEMLNVQNQISMKVQGEMDRHQKEYFLRQQMKAIQKELGEDDEAQEDIQAYRERMDKLELSEATREELTRQIDRLERMHPDAAESTVLRNYVEWMLDLPWGINTPDNLNLPHAEQILNKDHFGLDKVKTRILEYLSVRKLTSAQRGPILCFVGPPGVGKTSLGRSIARALKKQFVRVSLGGVRDEAEIRGHRRTYVGAMPGKIIQELKKAESGNPVFMLDEVDKIGADFRGDPSSALLEVLDPEQNQSFVDHYLGVPFDLSNVLFIATANQLEPIQPAFLDRMEVIEIHGYTEEEKIEIAKRHLIPRQREKNGLTPALIRFTTPALRQVIALYTREAGVRNLERELGAICRKVAHRVASGDTQPVRITPANLETFAGPAKLFRHQLLEEDTVGVTPGMAWTPYGGDILFIEVTLLPGKGKLTLTGSLGEVMKESATAALTFLRSQAEVLGIPLERFEDRDIHIHVPEGATPKDGPSAGVTLTTALCSAFTGVPVRRDVAMTGEITLRGRVLPVGGIKEKVLSAKRAGITTILLPEKNAKDLQELKEDAREGMTFILLKDAREAVNAATVRPLFP